ncbi:A disintegrin and metalloproteinase with thrombospondin motifs 17-like [Battus philenor]|uniref:A disintegrin and metalloproteinase with thrombospondin motifs 17-like n=1 Tax=Battus philenor TaxID=42288 RepID=UPI0035CEC99B
MKYLFICMICCAFDIGNGRIASDFDLYKNSHRFNLSKQQHKTNDVTINIMIHLDKVLTNKLVKEYGAKTRKRLKQISNGILNEVQNAYKHASLDQNIRFKLQDTRFLKNNTKVVKMDENGSTYLKSYCEWQSQKKTADNWYFSVLLTGLDVYYVSKTGEKVRRSTGRGYVGGICSTKKSCALLEWHPRNIGYLLSHEIAHSLGINHDGAPYNQCHGQRQMMGARYDPINHPRVWSPCSKYALKRFLGSEKSWCLHPGAEKIKRKSYVS